MSRQDERDAWTKMAERQGNWETRVTPQKASKYGNRPVLVNGHRFDSKKEGARYVELTYMLKAGTIAELELQPAFPLLCVKLYRNGWPITLEPVATYVADFQYLNLTTGEYIVEDVKSAGTRTAIYALKKKMVEAIHGITVREV